MEWDDNIGDVVRTKFLDSNMSETVLQEEEFSPRSVWTRICDVSTCVECPVTASSPTGYAVDAAGPGKMGEVTCFRSFPKPSEVKMFF
jgi:hypothetical protein